MKLIKSLLVITAMATLAAGCGTNTAAQAVDIRSTTSSTTESVTTVSASIDEALVSNSSYNGELENASEVEGAGQTITLSDAGSTSSDSSVSINGSIVTITKPGSYIVTGSLSNGQLVVNSAEDGTVELVLSGVELTNASGSAIQVLNAQDVLITLADGTNNKITDGANYAVTGSDEDQPNAALYSSSDLVIAGTGALVLTGNFNDGITSKDGLIIQNGNITVNAVDDGIRGKDFVVISSGTIQVTSGGDGVKSDNAEDAEKGYVLVEDGTVTITSAGDAISAETDVLIKDGNFTLVSGGGSSATIAEDVSAKGIKGTISVVIDGGTFAIDSADDAIHSNTGIVVNNGQFTIQSDDDGMHADATLKIVNGEIDIVQAYEGLESALVEINGGSIQMITSDDGINVAGGNDGSGMGGGPGGGGGPRGNRQQDTFAASGSYMLTITGGSILVNAEGDGLDSNGSMTMSGGTVVVFGPPRSGNGSLDYNGTFNITGGYLIAAGSSGMAMTPSDSSTQSSLMVNFTNANAANTTVAIADTSGKVIAVVQPVKTFQTLLVSSADLQQGQSYKVLVGGSASGAPVNGLITDGEYSGGSQYAEVKLSGINTWYGTQSRNH